MSKSPYISPSKGYSKLLTKYGHVDRTIQEMQRIAKENAWQVEELANDLDSEDLYEVAENIFNFLKDNLNYEEDSPDGSEVLRTPARTWSDKAGDCDCFTIFISAILINLDIYHVYRVVSYTGSQDWVHVYPVIIIDDYSKEIPLDTVPEILHFLQEKTYTYKQDYPMKTLELGNATGKTDLEVLSDFGLDIAPDAIVSKNEFTYSLLLAIISEMQTSLMMQPQTEITMVEFQRLKNIETSFENPQRVLELINEGISLSQLSQIYEALYKIAQDCIYGDNFDITVSELFDYYRPVLINVVGSQTLGFIGGLISAVGGVVGTIVGSKNNKEAAKEATKQAEIQAKTSADANAVALQVEQLRLQKAQLEAQTAQAAAISKNAEEPKQKPKPFYKQNWFLISGGIGLVLLVVLVWYLMKPKKELKGIPKRRKRRTTATKRTSPRKRLSSASSKLSRPRPKRRVSSTPKRKRRLSESRSNNLRRKSKPRTRTTKKR